MNNENGRWVTINGAHVFIKKGQSPEEALAELQNKKKPEKYFRVIHRSYTGDTTFITPDTELDKYDSDWYEKEEIDMKKYLDLLEKEDPSKLPPLREFDWYFRNKYADVPGDIRGFLYRELKNKMAEYQMTLADEFLANIPKHKDISTEECLLGVNSDRYKESIKYQYDDPKYAAYSYNCQRCAPAFVLRYCHGYAVVAKPAEKAWNPNSNEFYSVGADDKLRTYAKRCGYNKNEWGSPTGWCGWDAVIFNIDDVRKTMIDGPGMARELGNEQMYKGTRHQLRYINKAVKEAGDGAVFICSVAWKGTKKRGGNYSGHSFVILNEGGKVKFYDPQSGQECSRYFTEKQIVANQTLMYRADNCRLNGTMMEEVVERE